MMIIFHKMLIAITLTIPLLSALSCGEDPITPGKPSGNSPAIAGFSSDDYGFAVYDTDSRRLIMEHNIYSQFIPASTTKLLTAIMANETLGDGFQFTTGVYYTGSIKDGAITGDIYIRGSGDPELTVHDLALLAESVKVNGVTSVHGNFYYDESALDPQDMLDRNMADYAPYNSGIGALNLDKNILQVIRRNNGKENSLQYEFLPAVNSVAFEISSGKPVFPFVSYSYKNGRETWSLPPAKILPPRYQLPVKHTGNYTASVFSILCAVHGIKLKEPMPAAVPDGSKKLCSHESRELRMILPCMLISSDNLTAEVLGRLVCRKYSENEGRRMNFNEAAALFFSRKFTSVKRDGFIASNASGLSTGNRLTPEQVLSMLIYLQKKYRLEDILPMSGESGTLKSRLDSPPAAYRVYAKTGSLNYSSALAGMFYGDSGRKYLFALFIDNKGERAVLDSRKTRDKGDFQAAEKWSKKASDAADSFITGLIQAL